MDSKPPFFLIVLVLCAASFILFFVLGEPNIVPSQQLSASLFTDDKSVIVLMQEGKFEPEELQIKSGTRVIFKNTDTKLRWPASNLHPTHGIYPEFDPDAQIAPTEEWAFVFRKKGRWRYHDHLIPSIRGTIVVF